MAATATATWQFEGDYFENCSCEVACPCLFSAAPPLSSKPSSPDGSCEVPIAFHIDSGRFGDTVLDGLNAVLVGRTPGPMGEGGMQVALYLDERADETQQQALTTIFTGAAGGPMALLAPLVGEVLGVRTARIDYRIDGKRRSCEIPGVMSLAVRPVQSLDPDADLVVTNAHPFAMGGLAMAVGEEGSTYADHGFSFDNSGRNGHYARIAWSSGG